MWVAALILIVLFIYSVISFAFLHESVNNQDMSLYCNTLGECFVTVIRVGLINSLGSVGCVRQGI